MNDGVDYVYDEAAVQARGWVFKTVELDDVTLPENLKAKALAYLADCVKEQVTLELNAIDLNLLDRSIDSFRLGDYVRVVSPPHDFAETLLCARMTFDVLKPENDTVILGGSYSSFTGMSARATSDVTTLKKRVGYISAEQKLTSLLTRSFGVFKTEQVLSDGSTVYYLHDRPELSDSVNIWKLTGSAFAVSSDGGETWNAGVDSEGNVVLNILSAIGIDASWIKTNNLSAISASIGGWEIKDGTLFTEYTFEGKLYRAYLNPPRLHYFSTGSNIIVIEESEDNGETFKEVLHIGKNGLSAKRYLNGAAWLYTTIATGSLTVGNAQTGKYLQVAYDGVTQGNF